ncbi:MAG: SPASM domain-containing protein [Prevotella sp.]|nr:SPASM domain-containing protein [Prevotella sp.]
MSKLTQQLRHNWFKLRVRLMLPVRRSELSDALTIELTNRCTLACSCCPNGREPQGCRPKHNMTAATFQQLLRQIDIPFHQVYLHLHGEPFLNKDLPDIVEQLRRRGVRQYSIFSNGYHIDLSVLEQLLAKTEDCELDLCFSAELYSKQSYEKIRCPGQYETACQSLDAIDEVMARHGKSYSLIAIIDEEAIGELSHTVPPLFSRYRQLRDIRFSSAFPWPHLPETGAIAGHLGHRRRICSHLWHLPVILASGEVSMCSNDYRGECIVGSLHDHKYSRLLNNRAARRFRRNIACREADRNSICRECLIDRLDTFSRIVRRHFVETAKEESLNKYFASYHKYFDVEKD